MYRHTHNSKYNNTHSLPTLLLRHQSSETFPALYVETCVQRHIRFFVASKLLFHCYSLSNRMEVIPTVDEDEALRNIQRQSEDSDINSNDAKLSESEEAIIAEDGGVAGNNNRGDEGVLEGVAVGNIDVYSSDSDEDEVRCIDSCSETEMQ